MKKLRITSSTVLIILFVGIGSAFSQISVGLQAGVARSESAHSKQFPTVGLSIKHLVSPHFALGIAAKAYADLQEFKVGSEKLEAIGAIVPLTGTVDFYLTKGGIRPYIGGDVGAYFSNYEISHNDQKFVQGKKETNFGVAPRLGILFAFGNFGIQVEGIYHFVSGNNNYGYTNNALSKINIETNAKAYGFTVGLIFGLGKKKFNS